MPQIGQRAGQCNRHADVRPARPDRKTVMTSTTTGATSGDVPGRNVTAFFDTGSNAYFFNDTSGKLPACPKNTVLLPVDDDQQFGDADWPERRERHGDDARRERGILPRTRRRSRSTTRGSVRLVQLARHRHAALLQPDDLLRDGQDRERRGGASSRSDAARRHAGPGASDRPFYSGARGTTGPTGSAPRAGTAPTM